MEMTKQQQQAQIEKAIFDLASIDSFDAEMAHIDADEVVLNYLRRTGAAAVANAYENLKAKAGFHFA
jgi:hypothetical protein